MARIRIQSDNSQSNPSISNPLKAGSESARDIGGSNVSHYNFEIYPDIFHNSEGKQKNGDWCDFTQRNRHIPSSNCDTQLIFCLASSDERVAAAFGRANQESGLPNLILRYERDQ